MTEISFAYTVTAADFNATAVPANSIVSNGWTTSGSTFVNRDPCPLSS